MPLEGLDGVLCDQKHVFVCLVNNKMEYKCMSLCVLEYGTSSGISPF